MKIGIVGLPNVGKSTLFNALLKKQAAFAANFPFATIEPNVGVVPVPDERLKQLAKVVNTEKIVPATVEFVDIAGLVKGASKGEGLGNKFLSHIREVNVICHVIRDFADTNVVQTGSGNAVDDFLVVETELQLADMETLLKQTEPKGKVQRAELVRFEGIKKLIAGLVKGLSARDVLLSDEERALTNDLMLLTAKKIVIAVNIGEDLVGQFGLIAKEVGENLQLAGVKVENTIVLPICAKMEEELAEFDDSEKRRYLKEVGLSETGLERLIEVSYGQLGLISFLTAGEKEVRAWTIVNGTKAPQAAGVIHSDFETKFIKAKVCNFVDFIRLGGWKKSAEEGKVRIEGKEYTIKEGDVVEYMIGS